MKAVTGTQMHGLDRRTITEAGIPGEQLMLRAGLLAGAGILKWIKEIGFGDSNPKILILAGKGNNGGDALVVAKQLAEIGYDVSLHCTAPESEFSGDALTMFRRLPASLRDTVSHSLCADDFAASRLIVVDGLLGTGFHGALREPYKSWCALVNRSGHPVAALDIPSGLDADSGEADPDAVTADMTFTMAAPKTGMFSPAGIRHTGRLRILDIGIPAAYADELPDTVECTDDRFVKALWKREPFDAHKYTRGHLFVAGGCKYYPGAPLLSAEAGLRSGAGLVTCCLPEGAEFHASIPKAMIVRRLASQTGFFTARSASELLSLSEKAGAFVVGPGMGTAPEVVGFLEKMLAVKTPLVLDADALNLLSVQPELIRKLREREHPTVLTPHPGELKRLLVVLGADQGLPRTEAACLVARELNVYVIGKGARSVVVAPDGRTAVNLSGCPALATAGTGDLLAGMTGAWLLRSDLPVFDAVRAAVFLHGFVAEMTGPLDSRGFIADDFLPQIGPAIRGITRR